MPCISGQRASPRPGRAPMSRSPFSRPKSAVVESYWVLGGSSVGGVRVSGRGGQSPRPVMHSNFQIKTPRSITWVAVS